MYYWYYISISIYKYKYNSIYIFLFSSFVGRAKRAPHDIELWVGRGPKASNCGARHPTPHPSERHERKASDGFSSTGARNNLPATAPSRIELGLRGELKPDGRRAVSFPYFPTYSSKSLPVRWNLLPFSDRNHPNLIRTPLTLI